MIEKDKLEDEDEVGIVESEPVIPSATDQLHT